MATCSVVIPAFNSETTIGRCVRAVIDGDNCPSEVVVVDDASTDRTAEEARLAGARVISMPGRSGPAAARNFGVAQTTGDSIVFVDSDVVATVEAVSRLVNHVAVDSPWTAAFGSYDDAPEHPGFISQYRNLLHHYVHQEGKRDASTFWAGFGAIQREAFVGVGGFDAAKYPQSSIEDIELGVRLIRAGGRIRLDPDIQVKHLKRWTFTGMVKTDLLRRALPWSRLIAEHGRCPADLNLGWSQRLCGVTVVAALVIGCLGPWLWPSWWWVSIVPLVVLIVVILNPGLYRFLVRARGLFFAMRTVPLHLIYYAGSSVVFGGTLAMTWLGKMVSGLSSRSGD